MGRLIDADVLAQTFARIPEREHTAMFIDHILKTIDEQPNAAAVSLQRIDAMIKAIDCLPKIIVKDKDGEADVFCSMTLVFEIVKFYGDREEKSDIFNADILDQFETKQERGDDGEA